MEHLAQLQRIFREVFDDEALRIGLETSQSDVDGWDSVAQVKLVLTVESEFGVRLSTDDVSQARSVRELIAAIQRAPRI